MRKYVGLTVSLAALCVLAAQPAFAVCGAGGTLRSQDGEFGDSNIFSNPNWCAPTGTYCFADVGPALSPSTRGFYWALDTGDPTPGAGDDNGTHGGSFSNGGISQGGCGDEWICTIEADNATYSYPGVFFGGYASTSEVDGCGVAAFPATRCTCVLITDEWNGDGYFLVTSALHDPSGVFDFTQPVDAPLQLVPIPAPGITGTQRLQPSLDVVSDVKLPPPASGVYLKDGCDCAPTGFKVLQTILPRGSAAPTSRQVAAWNAPPDADGNPQPSTGAPFGTMPAQGISVRSACGMMNTDVYLTTQLVFPRGYTAQHVSSNSGRIECGPMLANPAPDRPDRPSDRQQGRVPFGRAGR